MKNYMFILLFVSLFPACVMSQSLEQGLLDILKAGYGEDYIRGYIQPFADHLAVSLNSTSYHSPNQSESLSIEIGLNLTLIPIPQNEQTFKATYGTMGIGYEEEVPTVYGDKQPVVIGAIPGTETENFMLPLLQLNLGLLPRISSSIRFIVTNIDYIGQLAVYGGSLSYHILKQDRANPYISDISAGVSINKFKLGSVLDNISYGAGLYIAKDISSLPLRSYAGINYYKSTLNVRSQEIWSDTPMGDITITGDPKFHLTLGMNYTYKIVKFYGDINVGKYNYITTGLYLIYK